MGNMGNIGDARRMGNIGNIGNIGDARRMGNMGNIGDARGMGNTEAERETPERVRKSQEGSRNKRK